MPEGWKRPDTSFQRFCANYTVDQKTQCWNWTGYLNKQGYGRFRGRYEKILAHRFSYTAFRDEITDGFEIDHLCRNPACVNPAHLELVTRKENQLRGNVNQNHNKTHCNQGHEFSDKNTYITKSGYRACRKCHARWTTNHRNRQPERNR